MIHTRLDSSGVLVAWTGNPNPATLADVKLKMKSATSGWNEASRRTSNAAELGKRRVIGRPAQRPSYLAGSAAAFLLAAPSLRSMWDANASTTTTPSAFSPANTGVRRVPTEG
jgi:hypothetical protein